MNDDFFSHIDENTINDSVTNIDSLIDSDNVWTVKIFNSIPCDNHESAIKSIKREYEYRFKYYLPDDFTLVSIDFSTHTPSVNIFFDKRFTLETIIRFSGIPETIQECELIYKCLLSKKTYPNLFNGFFLCKPGIPDKLYFFTKMQSVYNMLYRNYNVAFANGVNGFASICRFMNPNKFNNHDTFPEIVQKYNVIFSMISEMESMLGVKSRFNIMNVVQEMLLRHISHIQIQTHIDWEHDYGNFVNINNSVLKNINTKHIEHIITNTENVIFSLNGLSLCYSYNLNLHQPSFFPSVINTYTTQNEQVYNYDDNRDFFFTDSFYFADIKKREKLNMEECMELICKTILSKKPEIPLFSGLSKSPLQENDEMYCISVYLGETFFCNVLHSLSLGIKGCKSDVIYTLNSLLKINIEDYATVISN